MGLPPILSAREVRMSSRVILLVAVLVGVVPAAAVAQAPLDPELATPYHWRVVVKAQPHPLVTPTFRRRARRAAVRNAAPRDRAAARQRPRAGRAVRQGRPRRRGRAGRPAARPPAPAADPPGDRPAGRRPGGRGPAAGADRRAAAVHPA